MVTDHLRKDDIEWWKSQIGPLPPPFYTGNIVMPATIQGLNVMNSNGMNGVGGSQLPDGLLSVNIVSESKWIRGGVLVSRTKHAWHIGVELPGGMAFERTTMGTPGVAPQHPALWGWKLRVLPIGLAINSLFAAAPFLILSKTTIGVFRRIRAKRRRAKGLCERCAYILMTEQHTCSECGHQQRFIEQKVSASSDT